MNRTAAILLSRQSLRPCAGDTWVAKSIECVKWLKKRDITLCSSVGMPTWELLTSLGSIYRLHLNLYVPGIPERGLRQQLEKIREEFDLDPARTTFIPVPSDTHAGKAALWQLRDEWIVSRAQLIVPVSIRPGGKLQHLIETASNAGKGIIRDFQVEYDAHRTTLAYTITPEELNPELAEIGDRYLIHWTRAFDCPWPTETAIEYYRDIVSSDSYPRSAFHSLGNIIETGTIKASTNHMSGKIATVAFSATPPCLMTRLMRWRSRYRQMSFEPYGVGIEKGEAENLGIMPVGYVDDARKGHSAESDGRWLLQSRGRKSDWTRENEYRYRGDLDLSIVNKDRMILICRTTDEAERISHQSGIRAVSFTSPI